MTFQDFYNIIMNPANSIAAGQRQWQFAFNWLVVNRPDLSEQIRGKYELDPFYIEDRNSRIITNFISFCERNW